MFCPNCGKAEQTPDAYCRSCGEFLADPLGRYSLINRLLGVVSPEKQISINLTINLVTLIASSLLLVFLNGYFDGRYAKTHEPAPPIIYLVYLFLGLSAAWQLLSVVINLGLKSKLGNRKRSEVPLGLSKDEKSLASGTTPSSLPEANRENIVATSVTEESTRILDKSRRK